MNKALLVLGSLMLYSLPSLAAAEAGGAGVEFTTYPGEPQNFQPFYEGNQPARASVEVKDLATGKPIRDVWIELSITHVEGRGILNTGFPYLEGKETLGGRFFAPEGKLELQYLFPIRGNYRVEILAAPSTSSSPQFEPTLGIFRVHVKEPFYQIRNAGILVAVLFALGVFLGRVYARAVTAKEAGR